MADLMTEEPDFLDVEVEELESDHEHVPAAVRAAANGEVTEPGEQEVDATDWLLESDTPTPDEVEPTKIRLNVGTSSAKNTYWFVVPLPDAEFRKFRSMALGNRRSRRALQQGDVTQINEWEYHLAVVAAATVKPDLVEAARKKGVVDPREVLRHRFAHKPGLINQISGIVSDISGMDEADAEVVEQAAGNS